MRLVVLFLALLAAAQAPATVTDASANGFTVRHEIRTSVSADALWAALSQDVARWWHPDHTYSGDARNLSLELRPLGCFCETTAGGGSVVHLTVTFVQPGETLRLTGGLGPLGLMGVDGNMTISVLKADGETVLQLVYVVGGYSADGLDAIAPAVDAVLSEQMQRLATFAQTGSPTG